MSIQIDFQPKEGNITMKITSFKTTLSSLILFALAITPLTSSHAAETPNLILKISVENQAGPNVKVSFPLQALDQIVDELTKGQEEARKQLPIDPKVLIQTLAQSDGVDLVQVKGKENVRVWVEKPSEETRLDAQLIRVQINKFHNDDKREIDINVPVGVIQLAASMLRQSGNFDLIKVLEEMQKHQTGFQQ
jgi:methyl coenzyme M reductase subunit C-like uncharacterized protein (methanogenesis marker protein 7)